MAAGGSGKGGSRSLLLAWDVSAEQEEPWRRLLQELSGSRYEEYAQSRRALGVVTESVWFAPKATGGVTSARTGQGVDEWCSWLQRCKTSSWAVCPARVEEGRRLLRQGRRANKLEPGARRERTWPR
jgi:hypothetical protein